MRGKTIQQYLTCKFNHNNKALSSSKLGLARDETQQGIAQNMKKQQKFKNIKSHNMLGCTAECD